MKFAIIFAKISSEITKVNLIEFSIMRFMKNITAVTSSMNRNDYLLNTIKNCQKIKNLKSHIVIDYSSVEPIENLILDFNNLEIYRVNNQAIWNISRSYNAGFHIIETNYILKIDADVEIDSDFVNNLDYQIYDMIIFSNNSNDLGNWLIKTEIINNVNGFNEFITNGYDDHDLIKRIRDSNRDLKELTVQNKIKKIEHSNELRVNFSKSKFLNENENYFYAIRKAYNDCNGFISKKIIWSINQKRNYVIRNNEILINHLYTNKDLPFLINILCKYIFLKSFFKIYFRRNYFSLYSVYKRIIPYFLMPLPSKIIKNLFGFDIFPTLVQINKKL